jgi:hypothetical protein
MYMILRRVTLMAVFSRARDLRISPIPGFARYAAPVKTRLLLNLKQLILANNTLSIAR